MLTDIWKQETLMKLTSAGMICMLAAAAMTMFMDAGSGSVRPEPESALRLSMK